MSVADHLQIDLADYEHRVRTFIPGYDHLVNAAAAACAVALARVRRPVIVDLGVGTGTLAARCLDALPAASVVGIDNDPGMLQAAMKRFARRRGAVTLVRGDLARIPLPPADAIVATLTLHHVDSPAKKRALYRRCFAALSSGGVVVSGDCHPSSVEAIAARQAQGWVSHLRQSYSAAETRRFLKAWEAEDTYMTLEDELAIVQGAGFAVDVTWRRNGFAVIVGSKG